MATPSFSASPVILLLAFTSLFCKGASKTYWRDIQVLSQLKQKSTQTRYSPNIYTEKFTCGISCDVVSGGISRVTEITLDQAGYSGAISSTYWNLPFLRTLELSGNNFSGSIPDSLSKLASLQKLSLSSNSLTGSIPDSLGSLTGLEEAYLDNNGLQGQIPPSFNGLVNVKRFEIQGNKLNGEFPELSGLNSLYFFDASDNAISGLIPMKFPASLVELSMRNNYLQGSIPESIRNLGFLQVFDLSHNQLTGSIPASLFTHPSLQQLTLSNNQFSSVQSPGNPQTQSPLIAIDLSNNELGGLLPGFFGLMPKLSALSLENNRFTGLIPTQYALKTVAPEPNIAPFERLLLGGNYLIGPIPYPLLGLKPGSANVDLAGNCLFRCPTIFFFCQGGDQKSLMECKSFAPVIP
ncbi:hypothetical protein Nepgr_008354 [Nepenthes gracilis]|uniref:Uncharacterized protein n=1 Tax=Nepenthes gracilis TaxID=150966 RepID=A0AAD3S8V2_NEPGR|nr:hypothetical protein Nepgr_008354 [Nepenthes gracilis]